ncbi:TspO/MBR family protein [Candidatus Odyssella thessalonicensis]|uniref:TspO/MBR family protein n=1 Tax=Candidatus Odyssella thessalonicensis TaxID=84647 RepID=UPI000225ABD5|nr:TspO/MBR family protein [Candidatus Odyssella thessalonicensis]
MLSLVKCYYAEIIGALVCLSLGFLSGYSVKISDLSWYAALNKPSFAVPNWVFAPVWTVLYISIGIALGRMCKDKNNKGRLFFLFFTQLIFNLLWSPLFFYYQRIDLALYDIILLWLTLLVLIGSSRRASGIGWLLLPYFFWVSFAAVLNASIVYLNPS